MDKKIRQQNEFQKYKKGYETVVKLKQKYEAKKRQLLSTQMNSKYALRVLQKQKLILQKQATNRAKDETKEPKGNIFRRVGLIKKGDTKDLQNLAKKFSVMVTNEEAETAKLPVCENQENINKQAAEMAEIESLDPPDEIKLKVEHLKTGLSSDLKRVNDLIAQCEARGREYQKMVESNTKMVREVTGKLQNATIKKRILDERVCSIEKDIEDMNTRFNDMTKQKQLLEANYEKALQNFRFHSTN